MMIKKFFFFLTCALMLSCEDWQTKNPSLKKKNEVNLPQPPIEFHFDKKMLMGKWRLDKDGIKEEIRKNAGSKKNVELCLKSFEKVKNVEINFEDFGNYTLNANNNTVRGSWGISADSAAYWIRLSDDFIELHEVKELNTQRLVELPVAEWKRNFVPVKQVVYNKIN